MSVYSMDIRNSSIDPVRRRPYTPNIKEIFVPQIDLIHASSYFNLIPFFFFFFEPLQQSERYRHQHNGVSSIPIINRSW